MSYRSSAFLSLFTVAFASIALAAQAPATPPVNRGDAYADFALAHYDELLAEQEGGTHLDDALTHLREAISADPHSEYLPLQMADLLFRAGRTDPAIQQAKSVVAADPDSVAAHELLGEIYTRMAADPNGGADDAALAIAEYQTLVRLQPAESSYHVLLGRLYRAQGKNDQAEQELKAALAIDPGSEEATGNLVLLLSDEGKLDEASQVVDGAPEAARSPRLYAALAQALDDHQQHAAAAAAWRKALAMSPGDPDLTQNLAQSLLDGGDFAGAETIFQQLAEANPNSGDNFLHLAQAQEKLGKLADADRNMQTAQRLLPTDPEVGYYSALLSESEGKHDVAEATLRRALDATARADQHYSADEANNRAILIEKLAEIQQHAGDTAGALASYQQLAGLGGDYADRALSLEVQAYADGRQYDKATAAAESELTRHPDSQALRLEYANLLGLLGRTDDALTALKPLTDAGMPEAYLARAQAEQQAKRYSDAEADAQKAGQLATDNTGRAQAQDALGSIEEAEKHFDQAEASFKQALTLDPGNPDYLNNLGYMLADWGTQLPEAVNYLQQAVTREPDNGAFLDSLGWAYVKQNRFDEARPQLERAASLQPGDPTVLDHLAQAYLGSGNLEKAASSWEQALAAWQQTPPAEQDPAAEAAVRKKLEAVRAKLAKQ